MKRKRSLIHLEQQRSRRSSQETPAKSVPIEVAEAKSVPSFPLLVILQRGWCWLQQNGKIRVQAKSRRLRVSETVSLGEKRFVSIVEVDGHSFLIGGSSSNVALLTELADKKNITGFERTISEAWQRQEVA